MIKTETRVFCDACGKDVTKEYSGDIVILVRDNKIQDIQPDGYTLCINCMQSFAQWKKDRKNQSTERK